jgi:hypothetical protein
MRKHLHETARITVSTESKVVIYPQKHAKTAELFRRCNREEIRRRTDPPVGKGYWDNYVSVKLRIHGREIRMLLAEYPPTPWLIRDRIRRRGLDVILSSTVYLEYGGALHHRTSKEGKLVMKAIETGVEPEVYRLVYDHE